ncbi:MAG: hypothetical protein ISN26_01165 [Betaproteobacteria bacterium AqS2]|uniref:Calx-beta domain-containing protein n=1 Tax=Candidatus Amphirhobacter heronislandensis TaxID=1732024 RepID=A0A930UH01_9GAMM|nr:hypothetical protein [Betaproteobacteria bacterium AqS2]
MTFTSSNYSNAQTVTVTAAEDSDTSHETDTVTFSASGGITAPNVTKAVRIYDDEGPGYDITPTSLTMTEGGQATFQVRLKTQPSVNVNILNTKSSNIDIDTDPDTAGNQDGIFTFNRTDQTKIWSEYQTITIFAKQDSDMNDESGFVRFFTTNGDYSWQGNPPVLGAVAITVTDDDKPTPTGTIQISPAGTLIIDEGDSTGGTLSVSLSKAPSRIELVHSPNGQGHRRRRQRREPRNRHHHLLRNRRHRRPERHQGGLHHG